MNKWECQHKDCDRYVVGTGGAIGIKAIGWYFEPGPIIYCPVHRPDATRKRSYLHEQIFSREGFPTDTLEKCSQCAADLESARWQAIMHLVLGQGLREHEIEDINRLYPR